MKNVNKTWKIKENIVWNLENKYQITDIFGDIEKILNKHILKKS